jgi:hypothetical protein
LTTSYQSHSHPYSRPRNLQARSSRKPPSWQSVRALLRRSVQSGVGANEGFDRSERGRQSDRSVAGGRRRIDLRKVEHGISVFVHSMQERQPARDDLSTVDEGSSSSIASHHRANQSLAYPSKLKPVFVTTPWFKTSSSTPSWSQSSKVRGNNVHARP